MNKIFHKKISLLNPFIQKNIYKYKKQIVLKLMHTQNKKKIG